MNSGDGRVSRPVDSSPLDTSAGVVSAQRAADYRTAKDPAAIPGLVPESVMETSDDPLMTNPEIDGEDLTTPSGESFSQPASVFPTESTLILHT